jgi:hypothetical protein
VYGKIFYFRVSCTVDVFKYIVVRVGFEHETKNMKF